MKKIIQVVPSLNVGGAESLVKNYLLNIDRKKYDVELFVTGKRLHTSIEEELTAFGVKMTFLSELYKVNPAFPSAAKRLMIAIGWRRAVRKYIRDARPDVVHCHLSVARTMIVAAKELEDCRMFYTVHSDPDKYWKDGRNSDELQAVKTFISEHGMMLIALHKEAVSKLRQYYGDACDIRILNNGVNVAAYHTTSMKREKIREALNIAPDAYVLGHVGRFLTVKNHEFLVEIFRLVHEKKPEAVLCLVGDGELKEAIMNKVEQLGLRDVVIFLGNRNDVYDILSAFDGFVFPSTWEGFPLTMIEAQAAHLPCFVSDQVNHEVQLTNLVQFLSLKDGASAWADAIMSYEKQTYIDWHLSEYDIRNVVQQLIGIYGI